MNNNTNEKISLNCPNCGATVYKNDDSYYATCPFCDSEVCFNEIKEEVEVIRIRDNYDQALSEQEDSFQQTEKYYSDLKSWKLKRNLLFVTVFLLCFFAAFFGENNEDIAAIFLFPALFIALFAPFIIAMHHPYKMDYPKSTLKAEKNPVVALHLLFLMVIIFVLIVFICFLGVVAAFFLKEYVFSLY